MSKKLYNSPKLEYALIIKGCILCGSNDGQGMFDKPGGKTGGGNDAPRRRMF